MQAVHKSAYQSIHPMLTLLELDSLIACLREWMAVNLVTLNNEKVAPFSRGS